MVKQVPLCICVCWGVVALSASVFSACLSPLWISASCQSATVSARTSVCVSVHVALGGLCWFCCAVSVTYWAGLVGVPWLRCAVFTPSIYSPKHSRIYYTSYSLPPFSLYLFFSSVLYISLISCWLLLTCHFKSVAVFRWRVCRQPGIISSLQGAGLSFISQSLNQKRPIFLLPRS